MISSTHQPKYLFGKPNLLFKIPILTLVFGLFMVLQSTAQEASHEMVSPPEFSFTLQHTTVVVSDFEKSKEFYLELLQLQRIPADWLPENQMFVSAGGQLELHIGEVPGVEIKPSKFNHFALSVNDFDGFLNYLKTKGIVYTSLGGGEDYFVQKRPDGVRQTFIQDPDGYWIEFNDME